MSSSDQQLRMWMLQWRAGRNARGRRHAAIFIANAGYEDAEPESNRECLGTMYHVQGAPMGGFALEIRRNFNTGATDGIQTATRVALVDRRHVWRPPYGNYRSDDTVDRSTVDRYALQVRPPGPSRRLWIPDEVLDCQDWVEWFVQRLVTQRVVLPTALTFVRNASDARVAILPNPNERRSNMAAPAPNTASQAGSLVTNSTFQHSGNAWQPSAQSQLYADQQPMRSQSSHQVNHFQPPQSAASSSRQQQQSLQPISQSSQPAYSVYGQNTPTPTSMMLSPTPRTPLPVPVPQVPIPAPAVRAPMPAHIGQSEWHVNRRRYERYNHTAASWEFYDQNGRHWQAFG